MDDDVTGRVGFWLLAAVLTFVLFAASAPSSLYPVYAARWSFSTPTLTAIFSVYAGWLAWLRPEIGVPRQTRRLFGAATTSLVAMWSLGGLYLSLGPSRANNLRGGDSRLAGALVIGAGRGSKVTPKGLAIWSRRRMSTTPHR